MRYVLPFFFSSSSPHPSERVEEWVNGWVVFSCLLGLKHNNPEYYGCSYVIAKTPHYLLHPLLNISFRLFLSLNLGLWNAYIFSNIIPIKLILQFPNPILSFVLSSCSCPQWNNHFQISKSSNLKNWICVRKTWRETVITINQIESNRAKVLNKQGNKLNWSKHYK